ncbi:MAG: hypothetical protein EOQ60_23910 [Mesorhizobium sp.]|nr:hypothetical protein EOA91_01365 [Mesorhizobium sp. M1A.F.Ca.IN.022.04.1.1]RWG28137.1 MAG: hypothetical protein EOQ60_23910 [Mesorhizobium sp.]
MIGDRSRTERAVIGQVSTICFCRNRLEFGAVGNDDGELAFQHVGEFGRRGDFPLLAAAAEMMDRQAVVAQREIEVIHAGGSG